MGVSACEHVRVLSLPFRVFASCECVFCLQMALIVYVLCSSAVDVRQHSHLNVHSPCLCRAFRCYWLCFCSAIVSLTLSTLTALRVRHARISTGINAVSNEHTSLDPATTSSRAPLFDIPLSFSLNTLSASHLVNHRPPRERYWKVDQLSHPHGMLYTQGASLSLLALISSCLVLPANELPSPIEHMAFVA